MLVMYPLLPNMWSTAIGKKRKVGQKSVTKIENDKQENAYTRFEKAVEKIGKEKKEFNRTFTKFNQETTPEQEIIRYLFKEPTINGKPDQWYEEKDAYLRGDKHISLPCNNCQTVSTLAPGTTLFWRAFTKNYDHIDKFCCPKCIVGVKAELEAKLVGSKAVLSNSKTLDFTKRMTEKISKIEYFMAIANRFDPQWFSKKMPPLQTVNPLKDFSMATKMSDSTLMVKGDNEDTYLHLLSFKDDGDWYLFAERLVTLLGVDVRNSLGQTPLMYAARRGDYEMVKFLLHNGADKNEVCNKGCTILHYGVLGGDYNICQTFSNQSFISNDEDRIPLDYAVTTKYYNIIQLLLEDVSLITPTTIFEAALCCNTEAMKMLVGKRFTPTNDILHECAKYGHGEIISILMKTGKFDINARDETGKTPLMYAVRCRYLKAFQTILSFQPDVDILDNDGNNVFYHARLININVFGKILADYKFKIMRKNYLLTSNLDLSTDYGSDTESESGSEEEDYEGEFVTV